MQETVAGQPPEESPGGPLYSDLIQEALAEERARKDSMERRGIAMVTASAFLSALILSLLAFTFDNISELPRFETDAVWAALAGFVAAAALGLAVNRPVGYSEPTVDYLEKINQQTYWDGSEKTAAHRVNESRIETIKSYRDINGGKAKLLTLALIAQTIGIVALAALIIALVS
jgi:hypothetical protein